MTAEPHITHLQHKVTNPKTQCIHSLHFIQLSHKLHFLEKWYRRGSSLVSQSINFLSRQINPSIKKCIQMNMKKCQFDLNLTPGITENLPPPRLSLKN